jgi:RNA polymerase sigma-70 factor (ECF subfamily)
VTDRNDIPYGGEGGEPSSSLLVNARNGDPWAWQRLVSLTSPVVHRWCRRAGVPAADIADVGQDVYSGVVGGIVAFRRDRPNHSFLAWLHAITANKICDYWRRRKAEPPAAGGQGGLGVPGAECVEEGSGVSDLSEDRRLLYQRAVALIQTEFEEKTWQAFWRVEIEEQAPAEAAVALGMTVNAVYLAKCRVRKRLRDEFADLLDEDAPAPPAVAK